MTIQRKLYAAYGAIFVIGLVSTLVGITSILNLNRSLQDMGIRLASLIYDAGQIDTITSDLQADQRGMVLRALLKQDDKTAGLIRDYDASMKAVRGFTNDMQSLVKAPAAVEQVQKVSSRIDDMERLSLPFLDLARRGQISPATRLLDQGLAESTDQASALGASLLELEHMLAQKEAAEKKAEAVRAVWLMCLTLAPLFAGGLVALFIVRSLSAQLRNSVGKLATGAQDLAGMAGQVSASSQSLAEDASSQAAMIEETSASSEEINAMARRNLEHAGNASSRMDELREKMNSSSKGMEGATHAMADIRESSDRISGIIKTIDQIAFQTNILALNAAVESARAGDAGLGFAVVADEVRSLAQRCAQAAKETEDMVAQSQVVSREGAERVNTVAAELLLVQSILDEMATMVAEIKSGSQQQGQGIGQIAQALTRMEQSTQRSAASSEESAASAQELTGQSHTLGTVAQELAKMVGTDGASGKGQRPILLSRVARPA